MNVKLYVGNLPKTITDEELTTLFSQAGDLIMLDRITDRKSGKAKGIAFITMSTRSEADRAIHMCNTYALCKQKMKVNLAQSAFKL